MDEQETSNQGSLAGLLYEQDCPVGYNCLAMDCMKCLELHAERGGTTNGN